MTERQRFILIVLLASITFGAVVALIVAVALAGAKVDASPSLVGLLGTFVTVIMVLVGLLQNGQISQKTEAVNQRLNGELDGRIKAAVQFALKELPVVEGVVGVKVPAATVEPIDPHASAGAP